MSVSRRETEEHLARMYRVALRIVGDPHTAEDVVQDAWVKALRTARSFDGRSALVTWLHRITVNSAIDRLREETRPDRHAADVNGDLGAMLAQLGPTPDEAASQRELCCVVRTLTDELAEDCRRAFVLTQLDGYSYDEAAAIEQQPRGTIASRVFRAKKILMARIDELSGRRQGL